MIWRRLAAPFALLVLASPSVLAQSAPVAPRDAQLAIDHYHTGSEAFRAGHFQVAATEFRFAYDLTHDPALLFNVGSALYDGGDLPGARAAFAAYLQASPDAPNRALVEARIRAIEARESSSPPPVATVAVAAPSSPAPVAAPARVPPAAAPRATFPVGPVVVMGAGVLALGASGIFYAMRAGALQPCVENPDAWVCPTEGNASDARTDAMLTAVALGVGAAALVGGAVWLLVDRLGGGHGAPRPEVTAGVSSLPGGVALTIGGTF